MLPRSFVTTFLWMTTLCQQVYHSQIFFLFLLNKRKFPRVIELCFSCSRLRSSGTSLRKLSTEKGNRDCPEKNKRYFQKVPLILLCLNFSQSLTQLVWTRCPSISAFDTFKTGNHIFHFHPFYQSGDSLKITITSTPKEHLLDNTVFNFQFDMTATGSLSLISQFHIILQLASCWCKQSEHRRILRGVLPSYRQFHVVQELHPWYRSGCK